MHDTPLKLDVPNLIADPLTDVLRQGARQLLAQAVQAEVEAFLAQHAHLKDDQGRARVVRHGYHDERTVQTGVGPVEVQAPRVRDRAPKGQRLVFTSEVLPRYLRRSKSLEALIPWLYLKGVSTGDFQDALSALLGPGAPGLSPSTIARLKSGWSEEYDAWQQRDLSGKRFVYVWVDGVYFHVRLEEAKHCVLVVIGATSDGKKELLALSDGYRESEQAWLDVLRDLKQRGMNDPELAIGDGALGFWSALPKVFGTTRTQRCWVHKSANVLSKLPQSQQPGAKAKLHNIWLAATRKDAEKAFDAFVEGYQDKYPKAVECLHKDRAELLTFYDFPAKHWAHIRSTNPIESAFATVRLRTGKTRNALGRTALLSLVFKLCQAAEQRWLRLAGSELLRDVLERVPFVDGVRQQESAA